MRRVVPIRSIIDQIKEAEEQAAVIRQEAAVFARDAIASAHAQAEEAAAAALQSERIAFKQACDQAEADGRALEARILDERNTQTRAQCDKAGEHLPEAVAYLLRKVVEAE